MGRSAAQTKREINMMIDELRGFGADVQDNANSKCMTINGDHHDFPSIRDTHAYLTGCLTFARSNAARLDTTSHEASQQEGS